MNQHAISSQPADFGPAAHSEGEVGSVRDLWIALLIAVGLAIPGTWAFMLLSHMLPTWSPMMTVDEVYAAFHTNSLSMRLGLMLMLLTVPSFIPVFAALFLEMRRVEGAWPIWSYSQMILGCLSAIPGMISFALWTVCAYKPTYDPNTIYILSDLGWILFAYVVWPLTILQEVAVALVVFRDREQKVFPRWFGYMTLWDILVYIPGLVIPFVHSGPFAWSGILGLYLPLFSYGTWIVCFMTIFIRRRNKARLSATQ